MMVDEFLDYLRYEKNRSELTVDSYANDLESFEAYFKGLDDQLTWQSVDADVIRDWMEYMMDKGNRATSINRRLSALRSFFRFALARHLIDRDPSRLIKGPKKSKPLPQFVKEDEMDRLLDDVAWGDSFEEVRTRAILMVFYETGIRLSELVGLNETSVDMETCQIRVLGKRRKMRVIPFGEELRHALYIYNKVRARKVGQGSSAFFVTADGARMNGGQVRYEVRRQLAKVSTLHKRSPHVLRHSFATAMLNHDAGLESVKKLLGHASLATTEIYTHTTFEQLKRVYTKAHPRASL